VVTTRIILLCDSHQVCSISCTRSTELLKDVVLLAKAHYRVAKYPSQHVSIQQLQDDYKVSEFLEALKQFLNTRVTRQQVVFPMESDQFDVFNQLYVASRPSVVTGHGSSWQRIHARPKVATCGCKAESPARFDTAFVWDEGHQPSDFFGPNGKYSASCTRRVCTDGHFSDPYRSSPCHIQASLRAPQPLPASTSIHQMVHLPASL